MSSTSPASGSEAVGTTARPQPAPRAASSAGNVPRTARTRPSSANSPSRTVLSMARAGTSPAARSTAQASARSYTEPTLGSVAGERARVIRREGHFSPELATAARTRSRDSCSAVSGRPTR